MARTKAKVSGHDRRSAVYRAAIRWFVAKAPDLELDQHAQCWWLFCDGDAERNLAYAIAVWWLHPKVPPDAPC